MNRSFVQGTAAVLLGAASIFGWQRGDVSSAADVAPAIATTSTRPLDGAVVFRTKGCASCHAAPGWTPAHDLSYPDLTTAASWAGSRRPGVRDTEYVRESVRDPSAFLSPAYRGGAPSPMPTLPLSDAELDAIVSYLLRR